MKGNAVKLILMILAVGLLAGLTVASPIYKSGGKLYRVAKSPDGTPVFVAIPDQFIDLDAGTNVPGDPDDPENPTAPTSPGPAEPEEGFLGLTKFAWQRTSILTPTERSKAGSVKTMIFQAIADTKDSNSVAEVSKAVTKRIQEVFPDGAGNWGTWYGDVIGKIEAAESEGKIPNIAALRNAIIAVAVGLEGVK